MFKQLMNQPIEIILTSPLKECFTSRDESPGIFLQKYARIWKELTRSEYVLNQLFLASYQQGVIDSNGHLTKPPTLHQFQIALKAFEKEKIHSLTEYDRYWTEERIQKATSEETPIPPRGIDWQPKVEKIINTCESLWEQAKDHHFYEVFGGFIEGNKLRVIHLLLLATHWQESKRTESGLEITALQAFEAVTRRREQNRLQMKIARAEIKKQTGFGEHSKELTQLLLDYKNGEAEEAKLEKTLESLNEKLTRLRGEQAIRFHSLETKYHDPLTHSQAQHEKLESLLRDHITFPE